MQAIAASSGPLQSQKRWKLILELEKEPKPRLDKAGVSAKVISTLKAFDRFPKDFTDKVPAGTDTPTQP